MKRPVPLYELAEKTSNTDLAVQAIDALAGSVDAEVRCLEVRDRLRRWHERAEAPVLRASLERAIASLTCVE